MKLLKLRIGTMKHTQFFTPKMIPNSTTHVELKGGTRYGIFDINSGEGILSGHHSCGAEKFHLQQFINIEDINLNKSEIADLSTLHLSTFIHDLLYVPAVSVYLYQLVYQ